MYFYKVSTILILSPPSPILIRIALCDDGNSLTQAHSFLHFFNTQGIFFDHHNLERKNYGHCLGNIVLNNLYQISSMRFVKFI